MPKYRIFYDVMKALDLEITATNAEEAIAIATAGFENSSLYADGFSIDIWETEEVDND